MFFSFLPKTVKCIEVKYKLIKNNFFFLASKINQEQTNGMNLFHVQLHTIAELDIRQGFPN